MQKYTVKFYKDAVLICTCTIQAYTADEAMTNAEYALICIYPNVEYNCIEV